jgi:CelD/BcsL family acetyltransferase involved in cellulose biosynthesis
MKVEEVDNFQSLKDCWNNLLKRNLLGDNVFLTWDWLSTLWKHFSDGRKLLLLKVEDGDEVAAIAPLMLSKYKLPFFGTIKKVEFLGVRHSDYNNFIILKKEVECLRLILDYLINVVTDWDWIELKDIPETSENAGYLEKLFSDIPSKLRLDRRVCNICPYILLPNSYAVLTAKLSKNMRQNINKYLRKAKANHNVEFKKYDEAGFSVDEAMRVFMKLHEARWALEGLHGAFRDNQLFRDFHMEIAKIFSIKNWLGLYFLIADGKPVSVQYTFEYGDKVYYYLGGFDPNYSQYSIGNLTIMFMLERAVKNGFKEYDMMRGNEYYKRLWTNHYRRNFEFRLIPKDLRCKLYSWLTWNSVIGKLASKMKFSLKQMTI